MRLARVPASGQNERVRPLAVLRLALLAGGLLLACDHEAPPVASALDDHGASAGGCLQRCDAVPAACKRGCDQEALGCADRCRLVPPSDVVSPYFPQIAAYDPGAQVECYAGCESSGAMCTEMCPSLVDSCRKQCGAM